MSKEEPLVSVIVPCFNSGRYLQETLDNIFVQTYNPLEVILVDDGSTDNTAEIIHSQSDRIQSKFQANCGAGPAREVGTKMARGEFIQYVDSDDLLFPDAIEKRLSALMTTGGDVAYSDWQWLEETETGAFIPSTIRARTIEEANADAQIALFSEWWTPLVGLLYRRRIVERITWKNCLANDARFLFDACAAGARFIHVPGVRAYYRVHSRGISRDRPRWFRAVLEWAEDVEAFWRRNDALTHERRAALILYYEEIEKYARKQDRELHRDALDHILSLKRRGALYRLPVQWLGYGNVKRVARIRASLIRRLRLR